MMFVSVRAGSHKCVVNGCFFCFRRKHPLKSERSSCCESLLSASPTWTCCFTLDLRLALPIWEQKINVNKLMKNLCVQLTNQGHVEKLWIFYEIPSKFTPKDPPKRTYTASCACFHHIIKIKNILSHNSYIKIFENVRLIHSINSAANLYT